MYLSVVLGDLLKEHRLKGTEAARRSGIHQSVWSRWLSGEQPAMSNEHFEIIARTLFTTEHEQAQILRARLMNICTGPGSELIDIRIKEGSAGETRAESNPYRLPKKLRADVDIIVRNMPTDRNLRELVKCIAAYVEAHHKDQIGSGKKK